MDFLEFFRDAKGILSSKRLAGFCLILTAIYATVESILRQSDLFISLILGLATIGSSLLGATMLEKDKKLGDS